MFGLMEDPEHTTEQSQIVVCDPDTQEVIPEGIARLFLREQPA